MKTLLASLLLMSAVAHANRIKGTLVLTGSIKTKTAVNGVEVSCGSEIKGKGLFGGMYDVQNLGEQDQYGNPAYRVAMTIKLKSKDKDALPLDFEEKIVFSNLFPSGVNDNLYVTLTPKAPAPTPQNPRPVAPAKGTEARFTIDDSGYVKTIQVQTSVGVVNCSF